MLWTALLSFQTQSSVESFFSFVTEEKDIIDSALFLNACCCNRCLSLNFPNCNPKWFVKSIWFLFAGSLRLSKSLQTGTKSKPISETWGISLKDGEKMEKPSRQSAVGEACSAMLSMTSKIRGIILALRHCAPLAWICGGWSGSLKETARYPSGDGQHWVDYE